MNIQSSLYGNIQVYFKRNNHLLLKNIQFSKMIDTMITVEGLFTYVFFTDVTRDENNVPSYKLITQSDGTTTAKTPMGCFEDLRIDNDLQYICDKIDAYNE